MKIKWENDARVMSSALLCENYSDMKHFIPTFEKVGDNEYKCTCCNTIMVVKEPVLVHDDKGRLNMQVSAELKK